MGKLIDLTGKKFERLTVIERVGRSKDYQAVWLCICDCGTEKRVRSRDLKKGNTKSCGCLRLENFIKRSITHGHRKERLYGVWSKIKERCYNPNNKSYKRYGGRGIKMCEQWKMDYLAFREWALSNGYDKDAPFGECTIDRIDNDKGYSPDNCRWVDMLTQRKNQTRSKASVV